MKNNIKRILSLLCVFAIVLGSSFTNISFAEEKDEATKASSSEEATKPTEETKAVEETKPIEETKSTEETKTVEETKPTEETKTVVKSKDTEENATLSHDPGHYSVAVTLKVYARNKNGEEFIYREVPVWGIEGNEMSIPIKSMFKNVISAEGGDFQFVGDKLVGTAAEVDIKVVIEKDNYTPSTNPVRIIHKSGAWPIYNDAFTVYADPGTIIDYIPPTFEGYKYIGPSTLIAPPAGEELALEYYKITIPITVSFVDTAGNKIAHDTMIYGKINESYRFDPPTIQGYTFKTASSKKSNILYFNGVLDYVFYNEVDNIVLTYSSDGTTPVTPPITVTPTITKDKTTATKTSNKKVLPKTGSAKTYTTVAGIALLAAGFAVVGKKKKA